MKVAVYRNLNSGGYSVQCREGKLYGKVIAHCDAVDLLNPKFVVREAGRLKVAEEQRKNVHAFIVGDLHCASNWQPRYDIGGKPGELESVSTMLAEKVKYNPYQDTQFGYTVDFGGWQPIDAADTVMIDKTGVYAWGARTN